MADSKIIGYKKIFGLVLPDWVNETMVRIFGVAMLVVAAMFVVLFFVIWPAYGTLEGRQEDLMNNRESLETLRNSREGIARIRTDLSVAVQDRILAAMPRQYSPEGAIYMLRQISADTGVNIISYTLPSGVLVQSEAEVENGGAGTDMVEFASFPVRLTVAAPVENVLNFITRVEASLPFGVVSDLNLQEVTKLSRTQGDKTVQLALEIRFHQAMIRRLNINKIQPLTDQDLSVANQIASYNLLTIPETQDQINQVPSTSSGSIFGF